MSRWAGACPLHPPCRHGRSARALLHWQRSELWHVQSARAPRPRPPSRDACEPSRRCGEVLTYLRFASWRIQWEAWTRFTGLEVNHLRSAVSDTRVGYTSAHTTQAQFMTVQVPRAKARPKVRSNEALAARSYELCRLSVQEDRAVGVRYSFKETPPRREKRKQKQHGTPWTPGSAVRSPVAACAHMRPCQRPRRGRRQGSLLLSATAAV